MRTRGWLRYRWEEQVKKNVEKQGVEWMEMMEEETWIGRERWRLLYKTRPLGWGHEIRQRRRSSSSWVFYPRAGPSLQAQEPRLQFCRRQVFHHKLRNQGCSFTRDWIGAIASHCFPHPTLSLASEQTLKDLKSQGHQCGGEESGFDQLGPPDFTEIHHRG